MRGKREPVAVPGLEKADLAHILEAHARCGQIVDLIAVSPEDLEAMEPGARETNVAGVRVVRSEARRPGELVFHSRRPSQA